MVPDFGPEARTLLPELVTVRRELHRQPEVGLDLPRTQAAVVSSLGGLPLDVTLGRGLSSVVAVLRGGRPGPTVLLRADMDALPIAEETGLEYASGNGSMHACGHDLHTAGLIGTARLLAAHRDELPGTVVFMFQPGEEGPGGAVPMLEEGLLEASGERPVAAYGIHVAPGPRGLFVHRPGTILAGANVLDVAFTGVGGHSSRPEGAVDPVPALLEFATALQVMVTRRFSVFDPVVASVTQLEAGGPVNVIAPRARLGASVRTLSLASTETFAREARRLAEGIAAAHGVTAAVEWTQQYPVTVNDAEEDAHVGRVLAETFGPEGVTTADAPILASEDFSYVLQEVPGGFFFLFAGQDGPEGEWNHSPRVVFDDAVLGDQAAALASVAWARLLRG